MSAFYGYRGMRVLGGKMPAWRFLPPDPEIRLRYWHWDLLGPIPFIYEVYRGYAEDEYQDDFISFSFPENWASRLIIATIRDAPAYLTFTYDGVTDQPERRFDIGFARVEAAKGFKIRNAVPGNVSSYQIIPML